MCIRDRDESLSSTYHTSNGDIVLLAQTDSTLGTPALSSRTAGGTRDGWILRVSNMGELKSETPVSYTHLDVYKRQVHNDTYGHHGGDIALEVVADVVKGNIRKCDSLIRFGGDEFLLILANMPEKTLKKKLEKIRDQVHAAVIHECPHLRVSVSIGGVTQGEHETMDSAVRRADRLRYHAKTTKNEVVVESDNTLSESVQTKNYVKPLILIVDDCDMNREILREILSSDYSIMEACGGEEALSMIHQFGTGISLVLLDIVMPGLDGFPVSYTHLSHKSLHWAKKSSRGWTEFQHRTRFNNTELFSEI